MMRNKILTVALCSASMLAVTSCSDYLETGSPSTVTAKDVMSSVDNCRSAMDGTYTSLHNVLLNQVYGAGLYYALDVAGSDIERHPEGYDAQPARHQPESFYEGGNAEIIAGYNPTTYGKEAPSSAYAMLYNIITVTNTITDGISDVQLNGKDAESYKKIYAEAVCMRATCYRELIKYYGDVPFRNSLENQVNGLASRDYIYDVILGELEKYASWLSPVKAAEKNHFSSTYAYTLAGRIALEAAGYQTRRTDGSVNYVDGNGNALQYEKKGTDANAATYGRRTDYKNLYEKAQKFFGLAEQNLGDATFDENDYSTFFTQLHQEAEGSYADESIFEDEFMQGASGNDERPYSIGRPATGASKANYPCKSYGQCRINPAFYYGMFDPQDVRRDVSCTVTGTTNSIGAKKGGYECIIPFTPASQAKGGGIACGKFDENRQNTVWTANQRRSGINAPYMRVSEVYLGLAECYAVLGDEAKAKQYLAKTRDRAFRGDGRVDEFVSKYDNLFEAVIDERGFEFAAEGDRRFTLIRTGLIGKKVKELKELTAAMVQGLKDKGYYEFENGNVISNVIYTKRVDPKTEYNLNSRLTGVCPEGQEDNPVLYPGWRGQHDWENIYSSIYSSDGKSNLAIKGLFNKLSEEEVNALLEDGYSVQSWGADIVANEKEYVDYVFKGWDYESAPIYLFPFSLNARLGVTNGYGFSNGSTY